MEKTMAVFTLTMPNCGSWNGKWTGQKNLFARHLRIKYRGKLLFPELKEGSNYYNFGDGWGASVKVEFMSPSDARKATKGSQGFCGYDWMIDELCNHGRIFTVAERKKMDEERVVRNLQEIRHLISSLPTVERDNLIIDLYSRIKKDDRLNG